MGRYAEEKGGGSTFTPAPAGTFVARCFQVVDIGTQHSEWEGEAVVRNQIIVRWELPTEMMDVGGEQKPAIVQRFYTNSLHEKSALRRDLEAWRGKQFTPEELRRFDLAQILGKPCLVTVAHVQGKSGLKAKVTGVAGLLKGATCPPSFNKPSAFWIDEWDDNQFAALPEGFQRIIAESDEYKAAFSPPAKGKQDDGYDDMAKNRPPVEDEVPF